MEINQPSIGDHVKSPHAYVLDSEGNRKYSLLILDGSSFNTTNHPDLFLHLGTSVLDLRYSSDPRIPYKIVGDLYE